MFTVKRYPDVQYFYLWLRGTYQPLDGSRTLSISDVIPCTFAGISFDTVGVSLKAKIISAVTEYDRYMESVIPK